MKYVVVFVAGFLFGGWAVPLGFIVDLSPPRVFTVAAAGGLFGCWLFLLAGGRVEQFARTKRRSNEGKPADSAELEASGSGAGRLGRLVDRYGARGLGLVGPIVPGVTASVVGGLALGLDRRELGKWLTVGILVMYGLYTAGLAFLIALW